MERICAFVLLVFVSLCNADSPTFPNVIPLDCNATESEAGVALDLINEHRDQGFAFKLLRVVRAYRQESKKSHGGFIFYLTMDVLETGCSVLSGESWKNCTELVPFHEMVFGQCKAIIYISKPSRTMKLINYNCTISSVPPSVIHKMCPDCPSIIREITPEIRGKADKLIAEYNKNSNHTRYFKVDHVERARMQWVVGPSYFLKFTIKETVCLKTQSDVNLENCEFLKDKEALDVGQILMHVDKLSGVQVVESLI
ncbi:fetuin-B-like [Rhinophrynus dorsalis]